MNDIIARRGLPHSLISIPRMEEIAYKIAGEWLQDARDFFFNYRTVDNTARIS